MARYDELIGKQFGSYKLLQLLGIGAFAEVYLGEHIQLGYQVAIKILHSASLSSDDLRRFSTEAQILSSLNHPHIIRFFEFNTVSNIPYLVMGNAPNGSLAKRHSKKTSLSLSTVIAYASQIASALQYIHNKGIIHRDIKPHNIFIGFDPRSAYKATLHNLDGSGDRNNNELLLGSFGIATWVKSGSKERVGTLYYMAPEQFAGEAVSASDQYALGVVIYQWLCGSLPFEGSEPMQLAYQHLHELPSSLHSRNQSIPQAVEDVVMKALAKKPEDRYESVSAFAEALERAATGKRADTIDNQFGPYRTTRMLGKGDIGTVYLGERIRPQESVAIKVLHNASDKMVFRDHARKMVQLQHSNIVPTIGYGVEDGSPYLMMDYMPLETLSARNRKETILPLENILSYVKQIASALQYAHERGIYGDVRPKKMFIGPNNTVLVSGFDVVLNKDADPGRKVAKDYFEYRAPEQTQASCTPACNQYSLGIIVYEWLSGHVPFRGESVQIVYQHKRVTPPSLREKNPAIPHEVEEVVMKALAKEPERRFESIQDFAEALEEAIISNKADRYVLPDRSGEQFGKYRLVRRLGQGGFAEVYLGQHFKLNTFAAIKVLHTHMSAKELAAFEKEAQFIANLRHPSIVRVLDFDAEGSTPFLVMDHAPEGTMRQFHARGSRLSLPMVVKYVKQIADALQYAHDQKIIHRDVKPENMLIWSRESIMLSDFGLAVIAHSAKSWREQDKAGTAKYMAPEQFRGKAVPASDQYSLAITAYEWLCGLPPFDEGTDIQLGFRHLDEPVPPMSERGAVVSPEAELVIMKALEKDPLKRFGSVKEFAEALEKAAKVE